MEGASGSENRLPARTLKERLRAGGSTCGVLVVNPSCPAVELIGRAGFDYVILDLEHGPSTLESVEHMVMAAELAGIAPLARVATNDPYFIDVALDRGVHGVMVPHITTAAEAERAIRATRYAPEGDRGLHTNIRATRHHADDVTEYCRQANESMFVSLLVEGKEGIDNLEEIAALPGYDALFIGPYDLSQSLSLPGDVRGEAVTGAIRRAIGLSERNGKAAGTFAGTIEDANRWLEEGIRFLLYSTDNAIFFHACRSAARQIRCLAEGD